MDAAVVNIIIVGATAFFSNVFLGRQRSRFRKMSLMWWVMIHASIPLLIPLRIWLGTPVCFIPVFIGIAICGQWVGQRFFAIRKVTAYQKERNEPPCNDTL